MYNICYTKCMNRQQKNEIKALLRERRGLLREMSKLSLMIRGSFFQRYSTCSRPDCACRRGKRHGPRHYVAVTQGKIQKQHYVPNGQAEAVREGVGQYQRMMRIADRLTEINLELMKGGALDVSDR